MKIFRPICIISIALTLFLSGCTDKKDQGNKDNNIIADLSNQYQITAIGYGESKEKAVEDAKEDALRQFGFNIANNNGKSELVYAGKMIDFRIIEDFSEELKNGMWWEIKIEADIEKL